MVERTTEDVLDNFVDLDNKITKGLTFKSFQHSVKIKMTFVSQVRKLSKFYMQR